MPLKNGQIAPPIKVGIVGAGFMGTNHLRHLLEIHEAEVVGVYDIATERGIRVSQMYRVPFYENDEELLAAADMVVVAVPTSGHYAVTKKAILRDKHVFVEKPFMHTVDEARRIEALLQAHPVKIQIGHVERFHPVFQQLLELVRWDDVVSIELKRHIPLRKKVDVDVILAVMVHDLDLSFKIARRLQTDIAQVKAAGVTKRHLKIQPFADHVSAHILLGNGVFVHVSGNRAGAHHERRIQVIEKDRTVIADLLKDQIEILERTDRRSYHCKRKLLEVEKRETLKDEMRHFIQAILNNDRPEVSAEDGRRVMELSDLIAKEIYGS